MKRSDSVAIKRRPSPTEPASTPPPTSLLRPKIPKVEDPASTPAPASLVRPNILKVPAARPKTAVEPPIKPPRAKKASTATSPSALVGTSKPDPSPPAPLPGTSKQDPSPPAPLPGSSKQDPSPPAPLPATSKPDPSPQAPLPGTSRDSKTDAPGPSRDLANVLNDPDANVSSIHSSDSTLPVINVEEYMAELSRQDSSLREKSYFFKLSDRLREAAEDRDGVKRQDMDDFEKFAVDSAIGVLLALAKEAREWVVDRYPEMALVPRNPLPDLECVRQQRLKDVSGVEPPSLDLEPLRLSSMRNRVKHAVWGPTAVLWPPENKNKIHLAIEALIFIIAVINRANGTYPDSD